MDISSRGPGIRLSQQFGQLDIADCTGGLGGKRMAGAIEHQPFTRFGLDPRAAANSCQLSAETILGIGLTMCVQEYEFARPVTAAYQPTAEPPDGIGQRNDPRLRLPL